MSIKIIRAEPHAKILDWEFMDFTLYFEDALTFNVYDHLQALLKGWSWMGYYGAFGGTLHLISGIGFDESEPHIVEWSLDMSHVIPDPQVALKTLLHCLEMFSEKEHIRIEKLIIGSELVD